MIIDRQRATTTGPVSPETRSTGFRALPVAFLLSAVLNFTSPALGETTGDTKPRAANATAPIDEIIVTARKREESLIDVPIAVTPFTAESMEQLGLTRIGQLGRYTPGFSFNDVAGRQPAADRPTVRGLTTIRNGITNTSVASTFIDGVFVGGTIQSAGLYNLERVEILRGPQTALYGRGTYAGAINYVTRRPTGEFESEITMTGAEHDTVEANAWMSGPLIGDQLLFFIGGGHNQYGGEYQNTRDGSMVGGTETNDISGKLYWTPTENFDISLKLGYQATDDDHFVIYLQPSTLNNCCDRSAEAPRARQYYVGEAQPEDNVELYTDLLNDAGISGTQIDRRLAALDFNWTLPGDLTLHSITGYIDDEMERGFDSSYAAYNPFGPFPALVVDKTEQSDLSQELRFSSSEDQAVQWTLGGYYYEGESNLVESTGRSLTEEGVENLAAFGGLDWDSGNRWAASAELRWARDEITLENFANNGTGALTSSFNSTFNNLTPRLTGTYRVSDGTNLYANIAKGVKPGDFNSGSLPDEKYRVVDEEEVWSYEMGVKGRWWDGRATGSFAGYYLDVTDQQLGQILELADGTTQSIIQNVGRSSVYGLEAEGTVLITDGLSLSASYAYTDAEIREHIDPEHADLMGGDGSVAETDALGNVSGHRIPRVPEHMGSLIARYEQTLSAGLIGYISGDYTFESSKYAQVHNLIETGNSSLVGLRAGFDTGQWEFIVWGKNILNDETPTDLLRFYDRRYGTLDSSYPQEGTRAPSTSPRGFGISLPRGRQVGATLRFRF